MGQMEGIHSGIRCISRGQVGPDLAQESNPFVIHHSLGPWPKIDATSDWPWNTQYQTQC